jgi:hypothetical protein
MFATAKAVVTTKRANATQPDLAKSRSNTIHQAWHAQSRAFGDRAKAPSGAQSPRFRISVQLVR